MSGTVELLRRSRRLTEDEDGHRVWQVRQEVVRFEPSGLAVLLCDVWDRHWCRGAVERLGKLVGGMNRVVQAARSCGSLVIHAPSDTMDFYAGTPGRLRAQKAEAVTPPAGVAHGEPPLPVDASDGGCDTEENTAGVDRRVWTRQHPSIEIDHDRDVISDDGREVYNVLRGSAMERLLIMGVHTNMCILNRSFAIKQMVRWGVDTMLCRDLTDAMYDPACAPYVDHDEGTDLVIGYIEAHWCPTVASAEFLEALRIA